MAFSYTEVAEHSRRSMLQRRALQRASTLNCCCFFRPPQHPFCHLKTVNQNLEVMSNTDSPKSNKDGKTWYEANCHCGAVKYKIKLGEFDLPENQVNSCNCSICTKNGYLLVYPCTEDVVWHEGYDTLKNYRFGKQRFDHKFCSICGSSILIDFHDLMFPGKHAVNVSVPLALGAYLYFFLMGTRHA